VIDHGAIVAVGTPAELKREVSGDRVALQLSDPVRLASARVVLERLPGLSILRSEGDLLDFSVPDASGALPELLAALATAGVTLSGIEVRRPTLDDVFLSLTGRELRDQPIAA
jgi:ABC-2 type transport system ATP-binding protein